jgi:AraC-like DNA-binding protein
MSLSDQKTDPALDRLARLILDHTPHDGVHATRIPGLYVSRFTRPAANQVKTFFQPSLAMTVQGEKVIAMGREVFPFGASQMFAFPVAMPVEVSVKRASREEPLLGLRLELDPQKMAGLVLKVYPNGLPAVRERRRAGYVADADHGIIDAAKRLLECLLRPGDDELIAPLVIDEMMIRLLRSPIGVRIAEMGIADSGVQRVAKAIAWLREHYAQPVKVSELAEMAHMSESSFRAHFKAVTSMSPLQYQKALRLHEARRLLVSGSADAVTASGLVGYVSPSQFNRDYSRFFGCPPRKDAARLRERRSSERAETI